MGTFRIRAFNGEETTADERWLRRFEVSEQEEDEDASAEDELAIAQQDV